MEKQLKQQVREQVLEVKRLRDLRDERELDVLRQPGSLSRALVEDVELQLEREIQKETELLDRARQLPDYRELSEELYQLAVS